MNRDNFDMDGSPSNEINEDKNQKKNNIFIVLIFFVLLVLCLVVGYFYIIKNVDSNTEESKVEIIEESKPNVETIDINNGNKNDSQVKNISDSNVLPVVEDEEDKTLALDISKVQSAKAAQGAVHFVEHVVGSNEDLNSIANLYNLKVKTLISINDIKNVSGVKEGVVLSIPDRNGRYYIVQPGDMLSTISNEYCPNLGWKTLQEINGLTDTLLDVGDKIFIPDMSDIIANPTINTASNKFNLPTDGAIIAKYGQFIEDNPYNDDISLDGVLIKTNKPIYASANGIVVDIYNFNGKKVIKLSHEDGYESLYGNLDNISFSIGDEVNTQQIIGDLAKNNILYFSIIQSGIPLDPESFF